MPFFKSKKTVVFLSCGLLAVMVFGPLMVSALELRQDLQGVWKARVVEITDEREREIVGTGANQTVQDVSVQLLEGPREGEVISFTNDFVVLRENQSVYINYLIRDGAEIYSVRDVNRSGMLLSVGLLFLFTILVFGGKQGVRSILALGGSLVVIMYVLLPLLKQGYSPVLVSTFVAGIVLTCAIYFTHGFNRRSTIALVGTCSAVVITGIISWAAVYFGGFSGFGSDESVYLNFATGGMLNLPGILLSGIIIGVLGVLDDIAITQVAVINELYLHKPNLEIKEAYASALRIGKEHVGALVNTLFLAYVGTALPLLLLFSGTDASIGTVINQEIFAAEIVRACVGSVGLILCVPITTLLAAFLLRGNADPDFHGGHSHP